MHKLYFLLFAAFFTQINYSQCIEPGESPGDTSCISLFYKGTETNYTTVRAADGKVWLQQNLGSSAVATSSTDTEAYGDLFQWGRWDDGHQLRNSQTSPALPTPNNPLGLNGGSAIFYLSSPEWWKNGAAPTDQWNAINPETVTAMNGCDPCKALGEKWQMPTSEEWQALINAESITNITTAFESNLKLTIAGARNASGVYGNGVRGYYWSQTPSDNTNFAKYLYYSNFIVNTTAGGFREQGSSVRCIMSAPSYCTVSVDFDIEPITSVTFGEIHNVTSAVVNETPAYENFTSKIATVNREGIYNLTVKGNTVGLEHDIRVFIDWNQDKIFDMDTEYLTASLGSSNGEDSVEATFDIEIPYDATLGFTRMRIIKDMWNVYQEGEFDACLNAYYGQAEDYTVNIQETLSVNNPDILAFSVYPNPSSDIVTIAAKSEIKSISLYNTLGQLIKTQKNPEMTLSSLNTGVYLIEVTFANGQTETRKIIKQ